jgi:hypothetical protein
MDWTTKAAAVVMQLKPTLDPDVARSLARDLRRTQEPHMGPAEAVFRFYAVMPPGWFAVPVPTVEPWYEDLLVG